MELVEILKSNFDLDNSISLIAGIHHGILAKMAYKVAGGGSRVKARLCGGGAGSMAGTEDLHTRGPAASAQTAGLTSQQQHQKGFCKYLFPHKNSVGFREKTKPFVQG